MWQVGLRLADWKITVRYAHSSEFSGHNNGECRANMHDKSAEILILPTDREEDKAEELVLIHELLHLHINNLHVPDERNAEEEQVINCLAEPLYNLMQTIRAK